MTVVSVVRCNTPSQRCALINGAGDDQIDAIVPRLYKLGWRGSALCRSIRVCCEVANSCQYAYAPGLCRGTPGLTACNDVLYLHHEVEKVSAQRYGSWAPTCVIRT
jgi:hypothetical protein